MNVYMTEPLPVMAASLILQHALSWRRQVYSLYQLFLMPDYIRLICFA